MLNHNLSKKNLNLQKKYIYKYNYLINILTI